MTIIGKLLEKWEQLEKRYGLDVSEKTRYHESIEDELKALGIDLAEFELRLLLCDLITPNNLKRYLASEINTHISDEQKKEKIVVKFIGNWKVIFLNNGFDNYKFLDIKEI